MVRNSTKQNRSITVQLQAGDAAIADLGKMLGATGVPPFEVKKEYDRLTAAHRGEVIPVVVTISPDRTWSLRLKTPPTSWLIRAALGRMQGAHQPGHEIIASLTEDQLRAIAVRKLPDLNTSDVRAAMRIVAGTARSMGVGVLDPTAGHRATATATATADAIGVDPREQ